MDWLKNAVVDIAVTILIVLAATLDLGWARWFVLIYTPLMVILKIVAVLGSRSIRQLKQKPSDVPSWFYHLLFAVNLFISTGCALLAENSYQWWLIAGGWALIWGLSIAAVPRTRPVSAE